MTHTTGYITGALWKRWWEIPKTHYLIQ